VSVCSEKMAAPGEKSFCVLQYHASKSVVTVQRAFRAKYAKDPPTDKTIRAWYKQFTGTGCLSKCNCVLCIGGCLVCRPDSHLYSEHSCSKHVEKLK